MKPPLTRRQQSTYDAIFQHPLARHLHRREVHDMLGALADVTEEHNGNLKAIRNGQTLVLRATRERIISAKDELMQIRRFLKRSGDPAAEVPAQDGHILVVIDHRAARVYEAKVHGTVPHRIVPLDPQGFGRNLHFVQDDSNGQRKPERKSFYEAITKALRRATDILIFGSGTGASSAMEQLLAGWRKNHPDLARRVIGAMVLNVQHLTEDQLLGKAREFYHQRTLSGYEK
jgi:hypothetical protein